VIEPVFDKESALAELAQPLILLSPLQTPPSLRTSEQDKDESGVPVPGKLDVRETGVGEVVRKKKIILEDSQTNKEAVYKSPLRRTLDKENSPGRELELGTGAWLSKTRPVRRGVQRGPLRMPKHLDVLSRTAKARLNAEYAAWMAILGEIRLRC